MLYFSNICLIAKLFFTSFVLNDIHFMLHVSNTCLIAKLFSKNMTGPTTLAK